MLSMLRVTLLCLLALAIPAQGLAAATRLWCAPAHHGAAAVATAPSPMPSHEHQHEHPHAQAQHAAGITPDQADGRCTACAACCTAVALPAHIPLLTAPPLISALPLPSGPAGRTAFVTGGPDRPPRRLVA